MKTLVRIHRVGLLSSLLVFLLVFTQVAAASNAILIGKNYYDDIANYEAGFLNDLVTEKVLMTEGNLTNYRKMWLPLDEIRRLNDYRSITLRTATSALADHVLANNGEQIPFPFHDDQSFDDYIMNTHTPQGDYWNRWFYEQMPDLSLNRPFINQTYDYFYKNKSFENAYFSLHQAQGSSPWDDVPIRNTWSPEDTTNYVFRSLQGAAGFLNQKAGKTEYIYPGYAVPVVGRDQKVINNRYYLKHNNAPSPPFYRVETPLYFSYLFVGEGLVPNQLSFTDSIFSSFNIGYAAPNKIPDLMLNASNGFRVPMRYNSIRDDLMLAMRGRPFETAGLPQFVIASTNPMGGPLADSTRQFLHMRASMNMTKLHYDKTLSASHQLFFQSLAGGMNAPDALGSFAPLSAQVPRINGVYDVRGSRSSTGVPTSIGFLAQFKVFHRDGIDATDELHGTENSYALGTAAREADARYLIAMDHKMIEADNRLMYRPGTLLTPNAAQYSLEVTRPVIAPLIDPQSYQPGNNFDALLGASSIQVSDPGLSPFAAEGPVAVDPSRVRVHLRTAGNPWSNAMNYLQLEAFLADKIGQDFDLLYTYVATDASDSNVGLLPASIPDNTGAYAIPLLRRIRVSDQSSGDPVATEPSRPEETRPVTETEAPLPAGLVVQFVDAQGNLLAPIVQEQVLRGTPYTTSPLDIAGYRLVAVPVNHAGIMGLNLVTVTYVYEKLPPAETLASLAQLPAAATNRQVLAGARLPATGMQGTLALMPLLGLGLFLIAGAGKRKG